MGLDVAFNRQQAIEAGLQLHTERRGSDADIAAAEQDEADGMPNQPGYMDWLKEEMVLVHVPYCNHCVEDDGASEQIVVRANKWGRTYEPLTTWLREQGITWSEF